MPLTRIVFLPRLSEIEPDACPDATDVPLTVAVEVDWKIVGVTVREVVEELTETV
jgi:hypothetical protein